MADDSTEMSMNENKEGQVDAREKAPNMIDQVALSDNKQENDNIENALNADQVRLSDNKQHEESKQCEKSDETDEQLKKENNNMDDTLNTGQMSDDNNAGGLKSGQMLANRFGSESGAKPKQIPGAISDPSISTSRELGSGTPSSQKSMVSSDPLLWYNRELSVHMLTSTDGLLNRTSSSTILAITAVGNIYVNGPDQSFQIARVNVRWANLCWFTGIHGQSHKCCILLSYFEAGEIALIAFIPQIGCEEMMYLMAEVMKMNYTAIPGYSDEATSRAISMAQSLPIYAGFVSTEVRSSESGTVMEGPMFVTVDVEAVCTYRDLGRRRLEQLMFWSESSPESIDLIKHNQEINTFNFVSQKADVLLPVKEENMQFVTAIRSHLHVLRPQPRGILTNIPLMAQLQPNIATSEPSRPAQHSNDGDRREKKRQGLPNRWPERRGHDSELGDRGSDRKSSSGRSETPHQRDKPGKPNIHPQENVSPQGRLYESQSYSSEVVSKIIDEVMRAEEQVAMSEELQMMWITMESDIQDLAQEGMVPESDYDSGGLSPDNPDHLKRALDDVGDQLRDCCLPEALSRLRGCIKLFLQSSNADIRSLMCEDELTLMKQMYYRSLLF